MAQDKPAVKHLGPNHDIILNTGKMRDSTWTQRFRGPPPMVSPDILDAAIAKACREEVSATARSHGGTH